MRAEAGELEIQLQWRSSKILQVRVASNPLEILLRVGQVASNPLVKWKGIFQLTKKLGMRKDSNGDETESTEARSSHRPPNKSAEKQDLDGVAFYIECMLASHELNSIL